ncbi:unnamed protein product [Linum trigynum]
MMFVLLIAVVPSTTVAKYFIVGDEVGWTTNFDYQSWTVGKDFHVGDKLVFRYPKGFHNVFKVNGTEFQNCLVPSNSSLRLDSGSDIVTLLTPGRKWYICGVAKHCKQQTQKLVIQVQPPIVIVPAPAPAPAPSPSSSAPIQTVAPSPAHGWQRASGPSSISP